MSRLNKVLYENTIKTQTKSKKVKTIPQYSATGKIKRAEMSRKKKTLSIILLCFMLLIILIYVPAIIESRKKGETMQGYTVSVNSNAIKLSNDEIAKNPNADFDGDGIDNTKEQTEGTNIYSEDSDFDGASDYYELYVSKTNPNYYDSNTVINIQKDYDQAQGKDVSSPYKMGNVILWADDYESKATGGVVETITGYHFYNFTGYAQFPADKGNYVYGIKNNIHIPLKHLEEENAWKIKGYENIEIYNEKLKNIVEFTFFHKTVYADANIITNALAAILPNYGWVTATKKTSVDVEPDSDGWTTTSIEIPAYNFEESLRFAKNTNTLQDLQYVRSMIQNGRCVAVSLFDSYDGEYIGVIYGYDKIGNLLIADPQTKTHVGKLYVTEIGRKVLSNEGKFIYSTMFAWNGLGFSSKSGDRISFFAVSGASEGINDIYPDATQTDAVPDNTNEITTETIPNPTTEVLPQSQDTPQANEIPQEQQFPENTEAVEPQQITASPDMQTVPQ